MTWCSISDPASWGTRAHQSGRLSDLFGARLDAVAAAVLAHLGSRCENPCTELAMLVERRIAEKQAKDLLALGGQSLQRKCELWGKLDASDSIYRTICRFAKFFLLNW